MTILKRVILLGIILGCVTPGVAASPAVQPAAEIRDYQGKKLDPFDRSYDNSIRGPQQVDLKTYRLEITGLVAKPLQLRYPELQQLPRVSRAITLHCVEGWKEHLLFEGFSLPGLLQRARPAQGVKTVIFYGADGYSTSISYQEVLERDMLLALKINGLDLDAKRGMPLQLVAVDKLGYKWIKWVTRIELSDRSFQGYWERRGYDNQADIKK